MPAKPLKSAEPAFAELSLASDVSPRDRPRAMSVLARRRSSLPSAAELQIDPPSRSAEDAPAPLSPTPIHAAFASDPSAPPLPPKAIKVASLPPRIPRSREASVETVAAPGPPSSFAAAGPSSMVLASPTSATSRPPQVRRPPSPSQDLEDGPLFRASVAFNERRAKALRNSLKIFAKAATDSLSILQANAAAQTTMDDHLGALCSGTSSDVLSALYSGNLKARRGELAEHSRKEVEELRTLLDRVEETVERLKTVEKKRRSFESESKKHYEELAKYLARTEPDSAKAAALDSRQFARTAAWNRDRQDYHHYVEGLVEAEEAAVATWLRQWAGIVDDPSIRIADSEEARREIRDRQRASVARSLGEQIIDAVANEETFDVDEDGGILSDDPGSTSATSAGSALSSGGALAAKATRKKRRSSLPSFGADNGDGAGAGERFKGFLDKASHRISSAAHQAAHQISSAMPAPVGSSLSPPSSSGASPNPSVQSPPPPHSPSPSTQDLPLPPPPPAPKSATLSVPSNGQASNQRRKEGLLFATRSATGHTTTGDGGGSYSAHWCVLSEGQLVEFADFKALTVRNAPINLAFASVRISHNTDRRFCFEILTPSARRIYQATSEMEMMTWVAAISKSIESLLNGTSSVRHFDASRLKGTSTPYSLNDFGSTTSLLNRSPSSAPSSSLRPSNGGSPTSSSFPSSASTPSGLSGLSTRLPEWIGAPLSRRASLGSRLGRSKREFKSSVGPQPPHRRTSVSPSRTTAQDTLAEPSLPLANRSASSLVLLPAFSAEPAPTSTAAATDLEDEMERVVNGADGAEADDDLESETASAYEFDRRIQEGVLATADLNPDEVKYRNAARIQEIASRPENRICADCGTADPRWASWSLGITLCIRCSGVHRSLGTHCSKVRSIDLDDWNDEQIASMEAWGNAKANAWWEARKPTSMTVDSTTVSTFIKSKYVQKKYLASSAPVTNTSRQLPAIAESAQSIARR